MATSAPLRLLTADEFLAVDFDPDLKAELDNGVIRMRDGVTQRHDAIQVNLIAWIATRLRGTPYELFGSSLAVRTHGRSVRYPDLSVARRAGPAADHDLFIDAPLAVIEIGYQADEGGWLLRLNEYKALPSVELVALVDPDHERLHVFRRTGRRPETWSEVIHVEPADLAIPGLGVTIPHAEIFARD